MRTSAAVCALLMVLVAAYPTEARAQDAPALAQAPQAAAGSAAPVDTTSVRVFGGIINVGGSTGFLGGGGVGFRPFDNTQLEIQADGAYGRLGGGSFDSTSVSADASSSIIQISGDFLYNFKPLGDRTLTPFAGGGLLFHRADATIEITVPGAGTSESSFSASDTVLQLLGGIDLPVGERRSFRAELRLQFFEDTAVVVLGGLSF